MDDTAKAHEELARLRKAVALADAMDFMGHDSDTAKHCSDQDWRGISIIAEVAVPSHETRDVVVQLLIDRRVRRLHIQNLKLLMAARVAGHE
jgi:hypothetical protein